MSANTGAGGDRSGDVIGCWDCRRWWRHTARLLIWRLTRCQVKHSCTDRRQSV